MSKLNKKDLSIAEENKENFKESVIERKNLTNKFTIADIEKHLAYLKKLEKEAEGMMGLAKATKENIERNHGELIDSLSDKDRHHIYMWYEQFKQMEDIAPQLADIKEDIKTHDSYLDTIYDAFGFVKTKTPTEHGPG